MTTLQAGRLARRSLRMVAGRAWGGLRPGRGLVLRQPGAGDAVEALAAGRTPRPDERFTPQRRGVGAWQDVDPLVTPRWVARGGVLGVLVWGVAAGLRVRRELRGRKRAVGLPLR